MSAAGRTPGPGRRIVVAGEALIDLFSDPTGETLTAKPGGAPFNVAVGLARLGERPAYLGALSTDAFGRRLRARLAAEGAALDLARAVAAPTALSLVAVDDAGEPSYAFYGAGCADRAYPPEALPSDLGAPAALHLGSYALVAEPFAAALNRLTEGARAATPRPLIALDPNVRPGVAPDLDLWRARVAAQAARADLIKASAEDLSFLAPGQSLEAQAAAWLGMGARLVVITEGARGARAFSAEAEAASPAEPTVLEDALGAGDAFQAALISAALDLGERPLDRAALEGLLRPGLRAAALVCARRGAEPPFREQVFLRP